MILVERETEFRNIFEGKKVLGCDIETTGLDPLTDKLRTLQLGNGEETVIIDVFKTGREATKALVEPVLTDPEVVIAFQNGKFDMGFIKHQLGIDVNRVFDTFIGAKLVENKIKIAEKKERDPPGHFALGSLSERYCGIEMDKSEQKSDWSGVLSQTQLEYAEKDERVLHPLREAIIEKLKEKSLTKVAKLEFDAILPVAWQELNGFYLDIDAWVELAESLNDKATEYRMKIIEQLAQYVEQQGLFGEVIINLDSQMQVQDYFRKAGVPMPPSTKEFFLTPLRKDYPLVDWLLEYRGYTKAYGTFGEAFRKFVHPITGRIHPSIFTLGSVTGRMATSNPNLAQIPSDNGHRGCFKAQREGYSLVCFDYSQEELRILADFSQDAKFKAIFESGADFHRATAATIHNKRLEDVTPKERSDVKPVNFGVAYCIGRGKLSMSLGKTEDEAQEIINRYFNTFRVVKRWIDYQKYLVGINKFARTASGRICEYEFDSQERQYKAQAERYAVNFPIQGTASDILKSALRTTYEVCKPYGDDARLVNVVHDELDFEIKDELIPEIAPKLEAAMVESGNSFMRNVEIKVDKKVQKAWAKE